MSKIFSAFILVLTLTTVQAQTSNRYEENLDNLPERTYDLTIDYETVNYTGKDVRAMTFNGSIPGPNLVFNEGEFAIINVTNMMDVSTSVHWHGLILPNFYDGVPYLNTPPIKPGETQQYKFALKQSGTYWYHSHTGLQEQRGVYGSIQINPKESNLEYDKDLLLVLSDWMDENPKTQLRNLKRGNEWYLIKKNQVQSWDKVIKKGAVGAKLKMMWQRMPDMAILDNYYDHFLINGGPVQEYPDFKPGERVRLRFVNASAASYFWLTFGGEDPMLVSADGLDVVPVKKNKTLIGVAETYDFIVTIPSNGKLEVLATSQDGSGKASAYIGQGDIWKAPEVPEPDLIKLMEEMMSMGMKMGAPTAKFNPSKNDSIEKMKKYAMDMDGMKMDGMKMGKDSMGMKNDGKVGDTQKMQGDKMMDGNMSMDGMDMGYIIPQDKVIGDNMKTGGNPEFNYSYLKAPGDTSFEEGQPVREMLFNLTGNMNRYVWSINGIPLSETDKIKINQGEVVRITLNNMTMMHHPMHLHGHFFRVLNEHGERSPLKHTVNVAPMQKVVIEFDAVETGDWFFHCHVLYHINSGMARIFSYDTPRDERLEGYPLSNLTNEADHMWTWGEISAASHMSEFYLTTTNIRNQFIARAEYGWNKNLEAEVSYERWLNSYFRVFGGVNVENEMKDSMEELSTTAVAGVRYLLPLLIDADLRIDNNLRPQIGLSTATMIFRKVALYGEFEYMADFGWVTDFEEGTDFEKEITWQVGLEYVLSRDWSLMGSYDNRFGAGGGLSLRF
jgi:CopA family copper-resistance protein